MHSRNPATLPLIVIAITLLAGCKRQESASQTAPPPALPVAASPSPEMAHGTTEGAVPAGQVKYFAGSIGTTLGLQMKLARNGEQVTGSYFYKKVGTKIDLRGSVDKDGNLTLEEFAGDGTPTGVFKGLWQTDLDDGRVTIAGNWSKPNSEKKTAFSLREEPIDLSSSIELVGKQFREKNKKLRYEIDVDYPQIVAALDSRFDRFNQEARRLVMKKVSGFKKDMADFANETGAGEEEATAGSYLSAGYTIALARDDLISIEFDIGSYYSGAAHPNSHSEVLNFDVKAGKVLRLGDLFRPGAKYLQAISAYCIKDLKQQSRAQGADGLLSDDQIESGAAAEAKNYESWTITNRALHITFDAYQVGPYAAGPQKVKIPFATLKDLIQPDSPLGIVARLGSSQ